MERTKFSRTTRLVDLLIAPPSETGLKRISSVISKPYCNSLAYINHLFSSEDSNKESSSSCNSLYAPFSLPSPSLCDLPCPTIIPGTVLALDVLLCIGGYSLPLPPQDAGVI